MSNVKLRKKELKNGCQSLVLDYYPPIRNPKTGKYQRWEYLKLKIFKVPSDELERQHNKEIMQLAHTICSQRQIDVQHRRFGFLSTASKDSNFIDFFKSEARKRMQSDSDNWGMGLRYFIAFVGYDLRFPEVDDYLCEDYKNYLLSGPGISRTERPIKRNTAVSYYAKLRYVLRLAYKKGYLPFDLHAMVEPLTPKETHRERLTLDEFQLLAVTDSKSDLMKRACLFSGLTGLRFSDVQTLLWLEVRGAPGKYELQFSQEKTEGAEVLPVCDQAVGLMGERGDPSARVFRSLKYSSLKNFLVDWTARAGILKNITFHSFRHTFATLQLEAGTSIYTVSKLLGHKTVKTTEIYGKVVDSTKRKATTQIVLDLGEGDIKEEVTSDAPAYKFIVHWNREKF